MESILLHAQSNLTIMSLSGLYLTSKKKKSTYIHAFQRRVSPFVCMCMYMFCAKWESVQFRNCPAQSRNSHFVVQFRNCTGTILELRKGFW